VKATIGIDIEAPARLVFDLARDVERWPALLPHYVSVGVRERHADGSRTAEMVAVRAILPVLGLGIPVAWRARTWSEETTLQLRFRHLGGATRGMDVTWRFEPKAHGCQVSIEHDFRPRFAPWALFVDRLFVRPIAGRTLATFKSIAEAVGAAALATEVAAVSETPAVAHAAAPRKRATPSRKRSEPGSTPKTST
jgi:ribosome-associated toxin RatA of RatAB toxin-antitoxin module